MVIAALETVTRAGSVAVWHDQVCHAEAGDAARTHGARLPSELVSCLDRAGHHLRDVDVLAVVSGPGSFTGLRVGLAAVQGLALATSIPTIGIPTLEALATTWRLVSPAPARIVACLDGQRGEVFVEVFAVDDPARPLDQCPRLIAARVGTPAEVTAALATLGPGDPFVFVGDGAVRYAPMWAAQYPEAAVTAAPKLLAEAAAVLASTRVDAAAAPHALRPIYIRKPDVEIARDRRRAPRPGAVSVRRVTGADDLAAVQALQERSFTHPWRAEALHWELEHSSVARLYVAAASDGSIVAFCACWVVADELHINNVAVDPGHRRQGVARRLLREVLAEAVADGGRSATLEVRESNLAARKLYEDLGFHVEAVRKAYYQEPREDALILWHRRIAP